MILCTHHGKDVFCVVMQVSGLAHRLRLVLRSALLVDCEQHAGVAFPLVLVICRVWHSLSAVPVALAPPG